MIIMIYNNNLLCDLKSFVSICCIIWIIQSQILKWVTTSRLWTVHTWFTITEWMWMATVCGPGVRNFCSRFDPQNKKVKCSCYSRGLRGPQCSVFPWLMKQTGDITIESRPWGRSHMSSTALSFRTQFHRHVSKSLVDSFLSRVGPSGIRERKISPYGSTIWLWLT